MQSYPLFLLIPIIFSLSIHCSPIQNAAKSRTAYYNCTSNSTFFPSSAYNSNIKTLLEWLSSNGTRKDRFYNTTVSSENTADTVYGLFYCGRSIDIEGCQYCVTEAAKSILMLCHMAKEAIIWRNFCFLRYSNRNFFSTVERSPKLSFMNDQDYKGQVGHFNNILWDMLNNLRTEAANASEKFAGKTKNITGNQTLYGSAWCVPYLSTEDCSWCLSDAIVEIPTSCCRGKSGGRIIYPSCGVRYELYPFFNISTWEQQPTTLPPPSTPADRRTHDYYLAKNVTPFPSTTTLVLSERKQTSQVQKLKLKGILRENEKENDTISFATSKVYGEGKRRQQRITIFKVIVSVVISVVLLSVGCFCFLRRKERKNQEDILKESFGNDITTLESLRFDLAKIEAATHRFAKENMIGKGGFGEVYKGTLSDGQEIAVKRLIGSFGQGAVEFKNEVLVIAKLQHRNLVRLLGFCVEGEEKMLIYEYVPNKSLDYFLFDPQKRRELSWSDRHKIIGGIARGILYLHEDSRLKIIHRDLKPSNVLLDSNMNPKISDFGMARIVSADQTEENTCRIVGTYGYMSPEYAMHGQFSVKSDVFSFGVMVLEIISGKRKGSYESECFNDIRRYAWTKWMDQKPLELLDSSLEGSYPQEEVIKCIHIGLLCAQEDPNDRPTVATINFYLNSPLVNLPSLHEPAYFKHRGEEHRMPSLDKTGDSYSINEISLTTKFSPR